MASPSEIRRLFMEAYMRRFQPERDPKRIRVHEVVSCLRKSFLTRVFPRPIAAEKAVILFIGEHVHLILGEELRRHGWRVEEPVEAMRNGVALTGHPDAWRDGTVLELKTIFTLPREPLEHHLRQTRIYMALTGAGEGYLVYIGRGRGGVRVFQVSPCGGVLDWAFGRAVTLSRCLLEMVAPPKEPGWLCRYCEYVDLCRNLGESFKYVDDTAVTEGNV